MKNNDPFVEKEHGRSLINIAIFEGVLLACVAGVYLVTNNMAYLIGGIIGVTLISGPMILRWAQSRPKPDRSSTK